jgi:hypothetical protein
MKEYICEKINIVTIYYKMKIYSKNYLFMITKLDEILSYILNINWLYHFNYNWKVRLMWFHKKKLLYMFIKTLDEFFLNTSKIIQNVPKK